MDVRTGAGWRRIVVIGLPLVLLASLAAACGSAGSTSAAPSAGAATSSPPVVASPAAGAATRSICRPGT